MNRLLSSIISLGRSGWECLSFAQKTEDILSDGFDISTATEISESDLMKIFGYRIEPNTLSFFIVSDQGRNTSKKKFGADDIDICYASNWFALIHPNDSSHIIMPSQNKWITFNARKQCISVHVEKGKVWGSGGGAFQLDKNIGKEIVHTQVSIESIQTILAQALS